MSIEYNPLTKQVMSLVDLVDVQIDNLEKSLEECISDEELANFRRIYITGSGDSLIAGNTALKAFHKFSNDFGSKYFSMSPIDIARFEKFSGNTPPENILVIGISASGGPARVYEVLKRSKQFGFSTMAITNNPESRLGLEADYVLNVNTPPGDNSPGLRSYFGSQAALFMLAAKHGKARGISNMEEELKDSMRKYVHQYDNEFVEMQKKLDTVAEEFKDAKAFAYIGDDLNYQTSWFAAATMIEVSGHMCTIDDSESWCHVNHFAAEPKKIPVIINADISSNSISRITETLNQADELDHPTLLVINGDSNIIDVPDRTHVVQIPKNIEGYDFVSNLMNHSATSILASLVSEKISEPYFRGDSIAKGVLTIQNSEVVIVGDFND